MRRHRPCATFSFDRLPDRTTGGQTPATRFQAGCCHEPPADRHHHVPPAGHLGPLARGGRHPPPGRVHRGGPGRRRNSDAHPAAGTGGQRGRGGLPARRSGDLGRLRRQSLPLQRRAPPGHHRMARRPGRLRNGPGACRRRHRAPAARHLPRHADHGGRGGRQLDPARPGRGRQRRPFAGTRCVRRGRGDHRTRNPARTDPRRSGRGGLPPPPGRRRPSGIRSPRPRPTTACWRPWRHPATASGLRCNGIRRPNPTAGCSRRSPARPAMGLPGGRRRTPLRASCPPADARFATDRRAPLALDCPAGVTLCQAGTRAHAIRHRPGPDRPVDAAVVDPAGGLAQGETGLPSSRHLAARRPFRPDRRHRLRDQGDQPGPGRARVRIAPRTGEAEHPGGAGRRRGRPTG